MFSPDQIPIQLKIDVAKASMSKNGQKCCWKLETQTCCKLMIAKTRDLKRSKVDDIQKNQELKCRNLTISNR